MFKSAKIPGLVQNFISKKSTMEVKEIVSRKNIGRRQYETRVFTFQNTFQQNHIIW